MLPFGELQRSPSITINAILRNVLLRREKVFIDSLELDLKCLLEIKPLLRIILPKAITV